MCELPGDIAHNRPFGNYEKNLKATDVKIIS